MRVAFCTNIPPRRDGASLRGRNQAIIERLEEDGHDVDLLTGPEMLLHGEPPAYDVGMLCPNDLVEPVADVAGRLAAETTALALQAKGLPFVNPPLTRRYCANKVLAHIAFRSADLPQPATWTVAEMDGSPWPPEGLLVKPVSGSCGLGIAVAHSPREAHAHVAAAGDPCFLQELVSSARCIRVVATQEAVVGRYEKRVPRGTLIAVVSSGAKEVKVEARPDLDGLAMAMIQAVGLDIGGADVLESSGGQLYALEVNANFGFFPRNREILDALAKQVRVCGRRAPQ